MNGQQALLRQGSDELRQWLQQMVESFREGYARLSEDERKFVYSIDDLRSPSQIEVVWLQAPDVQYVLVTHFEDRDDLEISVDGPFPSYEAVSRLTEILENPKWNRAIDTESETRWILQNPQSFKEIIEDVFVGIVRDLRRLPFLRPVERPMVTAKTLLTSKASLWYVTGNLSKASPQSLVLEVIDQAKMQASVAIKTTQPPPSADASPRIGAYGGFVFPPVWIGKAPKPTFAEKLNIYLWFEVPR